MFSDTFAGIEPSSVPGFVLAQLVGAALGVGLVRVLYPDVAATADDVVVPQHDRRGSQRPRLGWHIRPPARKDLVTSTPRILYACKANGGRSVASKVLTEYYGGDAVEVFSAGSEPGDHIHAEVADVLTDLGLDVSGEVPKGFDTSRPTTSW